MEEHIMARYKIDKGDIPILVQGNWNLWKGKVLLAIEEAGLGDVLENATSHDEMDADSKQKSKMVRAAMLQRVNKEERSLLQRGTMLSAKDTWDHLHARYGIQNAATSMRILGKYRTLKKTPCESVMQYYTRALSLASKLRESGEKISEADIVATISMGYREIQSCEDNDQCKR
eukprot:scaffold244_cov372-Pavlova_lutheri.AAC.4